MNLFVCYSMKGTYGVVCIGTGRCVQGNVRSSLMLSGDTSLVLFLAFALAF